ncbi:MAG TPA: 2OG-Fe(II) oxygenase [Noviherbaspirillum sp.]|nr:2OG-Fe(II) oxygenase [Noviherbaspirillum sp.]
MLTTSVLVELPPQWRTWINDNLARGCDPGSMAQVMVRDGHFDARLARASIDEARSKRNRTPVEPALLPMPQINTASNTVLAGDREVDILLTLQSPRIVLLGNVLSEEECDALTAYGEQRLERSPVVADGDGSMHIHVHRTSRGAMMQRAEIPLIGRIESRLAALTGWPADCGEGLQLLRYEKGNEYRPHFDWFDPALPGPRKHLERGGQRLATIIMYLSEVEQGGGTAFPNIGLQIQPKKGSAVFFANTDASRIPEQAALHAGQPVEKGVKFIATKWLREKPYC